MKSQSIDKPELDDKQTSLQAQDDVRNATHRWLLAVHERQMVRVRRQRDIRDEPKRASNEKERTNGNSVVS